MKNILIVVDMQKGFARYEQTIALTKKIISLLERRVFDVVIATKFMNEENSIYEKLLGWKRLKTEEEQKIPDEIMTHVEYVEEKHIYNCVNSTFIQKLCQLNDGVYPDKVFIVGADTDCCVMTIATSLFENGIRPIVLKNYVDSNGGPLSHNAGLTCMRRLIGEKQLSDIDPNFPSDLNNI